MKKILKNKKGFTMIELIIVIAIIVILAAIAIPTFSGFVDTANQAAVTTEARNVYLAIKVEAVAEEMGTEGANPEDAANMAIEAGVDADNIKDLVVVDSGDISFTYTNNGYTVTYSSNVASAPAAASDSSTSD